MGDEVRVDPALKSLERLQSAESKLSTTCADSVVASVGSMRRFAPSATDRTAIQTANNTDELGISVYGPPGCGKPLLAKQLLIISCTCGERASS